MTGQSCQRFCHFSKPFWSTTLKLLIIFKIISKMIMPLTSNKKKLLFYARYYHLKKTFLEKCFKCAYAIFYFRFILCVLCAFKMTSLLFSIYCLRPYLSFNVGSRRITCCNILARIREQENHTWWWWEKRKFRGNRTLFLLKLPY